MAREKAAIAIARLVEGVGFISGRQWTIKKRRDIGNISWRMRGIKTRMSTQLFNCDSIPHILELGQDKDRCKKIALIADPPYGINLATDNDARGRSRMAQSHDYPEVHGDNEPFDPTLLLDFNIVVLWGGNNYSEKLPSKSKWLVWNKKCGFVETSHNSDFEIAWTNQDGAPRMFNHLWIGMLRNSEGEKGDYGLHPTQKPIKLFEWVIQTMKVPKDHTIVDPYMGVGACGIAAVRMGYNYIGYEIVKEYYDIACRRIEQEERKLTLFGKEELYNTDDKLYTPMALGIP